MIKDANNQMLIVEKYERLINYLHGQATLNGAILTILKQNLVWRLYDKD